MDRTCEVTRQENTPASRRVLAGVSARVHGARLLRSGPVSLGQQSERVFADDIGPFLRRICLLRWRYPTGKVSQSYAA